jgi:engulfment and cell motility protein 1
MDQADIPALLSRLASDEDASRKMAVFKLQSSINDPAFADVFISSGGLVVLRRLIMNATGNTLAYSLQSLTRLLEVDMGWDIFEGPTASELVERIVELIVKNPLVNILRGAMSILVSLVSHSQSSTSRGGQTKAPGMFGLRALRPAVAVYPHFFELVIQQLQSADHALCANALMLINALIRDALSRDGQNDASGRGAGEDWPTLMKRLQELGLIKAVYSLMRSSALQDLAHPMLEFQSLSKVLLGKWRSAKVDVEKSEHRRALKSIHLASAPERVNGHAREDSGGPNRKASKKHNPEKWRRLGFESESPGQEFGTAGYLGLMDMSDYVRRYEDGFQKLLLEQAAKPLPERLPFARASLAVTMVLYEHFEVDQTDLEDTRGYQGVDMTDHDRLFQPLILQWSRLHAAGLHGFFRLWKATGAQQGDFDKVTELVRILIEQVVGRATRAKDVLEAEDEMQEYDVGQLRELQMGMLELAFEDNWGQHLHQVREELKQEALQFVKEQRIRCLLQGSWFMRPQAKTLLWRFARLSHNRRFLHYADFERQTTHDPVLGSLTEKVDLNTISSVVSNVSAPNDDAKSTESSATAKNVTSNNTAKGTTKITIYSLAKQTDVTKSAENMEQPILTLWPPSHSLASEWLDGLLMLLKQAPITADTNKLVKMVSEYGLKIRLLNVRMDSAFEGPPPGAGVIPSRKELDEDYFFEV